MISRPREALASRDISRTLSANKLGCVCEVYNVCFVIKYAPCPFCAKTNEIGIRKKWGGENRGSPPQGPLLLCLILIPHCQKFFWQNLSVFVDHTKNIFGRIVFRPNIQALEKNVAKMAIFILPLLLWPEMTKMFQKNFWGMF